MEVLLNFAYTGSIYWDVMENFFGFLKDANFFGLDEAKEEGIKILISDLNPLIAIEAYTLSREVNSASLKSKSKKVILENIEVISSTDDFSKLNFESLKDILSNIPPVDPTEKIIEGILKWIESDLSTRKSYLQDILGTIQIWLADINMVVRISLKHK